MKKLNLPSLYAYIICLVMIVAFIIAGGNLVHWALNYVIPADATVQQAYIPPNITLTPDAKALYDQVSIQIQRNKQLAGVLTGLIMLVIIVPLWVYHWKQANKYRQSEGFDVNVHALYFYTASLITFCVAFIALMAAISTWLPYLLNANLSIPPLEGLYGKIGAPNSSMTVTKADIQNLMQQYSNTQYFPRDSIIAQLTAFIVALPLYLFHWRSAKKIYPQVPAA